MEHLLNSSYSREDWIKFLKNKFLPEDFELSREEVKLDFSSNYIDPKAFWIGDCESLGNLAVIEVQHESENDPRVGVSRDAFRLMAEHQINKALFFFVSKKTNNFRFSLITLELKLVGKNIKPVFSNPHRYSFFLGEEAKIHTPQEFLFEKGRIVNFDDLKDRFSIEVVNKEFYYGIQRLFYKLVGGEVKQGSQKYEFTPIIKLPFTQNHKTLQEFAVRLVGRLVFCWFLKKKKSDDNQLPLIPEELLSSGAVEDNYYHNVLEPLFFQILNTKIEDRLPKFRSQLYDSIPFLNGGLFDPKLHQDFYEADEMGNSKYINTLKIPDSWLQEFLELLEIYNFTIDENTSIDIDLSVDPEMLGRIFENLLAEINPETGKTARKSTGSYYTPRPIVEYMVDESLIQYLLTKLTPKFPETNQTPTGHCEESSAAELPKQSKLEKQIRELLDYNIEGTELPKEQKIAVIDALDKLKVLDPACGSGAFPMGVLQKMVLILDKVDPESIEWVMKQLERIPDPMVREAMEEKLMHENWKWRHKMGIIRNSIYGVDIQPIATEISKLRLFLTIIVDEKIEDDKENRNINALPNLSFKFVTANTLIGLPESEEQMSLFDDTLDELMQKLEDLRSKFFYKAGKEKAQIEAEFIETQQQIGQYLCQDGSENKRAIALANWKPFSDEASSWFDPTWMFGIKDGFDIVIGNPPYIKEYTDKNAFDGLRNSPYYQGKMDIWYFFACRSLDLLKDNSGPLSFIATNNWVTNFGASKMRNKVIEETQIIQLIDFNNFKIFESADIQTMVMLFKSNSEVDCYNFDYRKLKQNAINFKDVVDLLNRENSENNIIFSPKIKRTDFRDTFLVFNNPKLDSVLNKILNIDNFKLSEDEIAQGIVFPQDFLNKKNQRELGNLFKIGEGIFALTEIELDNLNLSEKEMELIKPYYTTQELHRYYGSRDNKLWIIYTSSEFKNPQKIEPYPNLKKHLDQFKDVISSDNKPYGLHRSRKEMFFKGEKVISLRKCANHPVFTYTDFDCYVSATFYVIKTNRINMKFLTGFLNSKLSAFWFRFKGKMQGNNYQIDKEPLVNIPIPRFSESMQQPIIKLVDKILSRIEAGENTQQLEDQIDLMVYKLYELTYGEAKIVDPELDSVLGQFGLGKEDFERMSVDELAEMEV
jgi:hypothetical protein